MKFCAFDIDESKTAMLSAGASPFYEPGFEEMLAAMLGTGRLRFTQDAQEATSGATVHFVCVGTPQLPGSDAADVRFVDSALQTIAANATCDGLTVGKSTVPVGKQLLSEEIWTYVTPPDPCAYISPTQTHAIVRISRTKLIRNSLTKMREATRLRTQCPTSLVPRFDGIANLKY
jgi:UDP-glucose/GDP-mannose dehydrogenase family, NAD binding domain